MGKAVIFYITWRLCEKMSIIDAHRHNMNAHQSLHRMKAGDTTYFERLDQYSRKYALPQE